MNRTINIPSELKQRIIDGVVIKLGVKDYFRLKDKLDGMFYLTKQFKRIYSSYCIQELLGVRLIDKNKPLFCINKFQLNDEKIMIVPTSDVLRIKIPDISDVNVYYVVKVNEDGNPPKATYLGKITKQKCVSFKKNNITSNSNNEVTGKPLTIITERELYDRNK